MEYAMLINHGLCFGCDSCKVSCMKEKNLPFEEPGITIQQIGPMKLDGKWEWDYVPVPTSLCDLCADRRAQGKKAACEQHCLSLVIEVLPVDQIGARMVELGGKKVSVFMP
ncbi:MAG: oxidoreductase [Eggerthellales bacterium]|nr:oxidoreductase [Eggerthellales bacterium]